MRTLFKIAPHIDICFRCDSFYTYKIGMGRRLMLRIAICDDEQLFVELEKKYIEDYLTDKDVGFKIDCFISGSSFLDHLCEDNNYQLVLLDVKMKSDNGLEIAKSVQSINPRIRVALVSAYANFAVSGYHVNAIRFILKDRLFEESLHECLEYVLSAMEYYDKKVSFEFLCGVKEISVNSIMYLDASLNYVQFVLDDPNDQSIYKVRGSLKNINAMMREYGFEAISQHRSVNLRHVVSIKDYKVIMDNGDRLTVSYRKINAFKRAFTLFEREMQM